tara:strand:+ start:11122 stop:11577 length:456 start_codon:yes stop_codon:yes gene_type:complete
MNNCSLIIWTFVITALWDVVLRLMSENYNMLPNFLQEYKFIKYLIPYFKKHTLLAAALIAGFIGATTQYIIIKLYKFPTNLKNIAYIIKFLIISFIISGLYGFIMKASKLFPYLEETYYKNLGLIKGIIHDGVSGLIVQLTLLVIINVLNL